MSYPLPTAAIPCAEEATERWCCPSCGGLNNAADVPGLTMSAAGWCQHDACVDLRGVVWHLGGTVVPEIQLAAVKPVWVEA